WRDGKGETGLPRIGRPRIDLSGLPLPGLSLPGLSLSGLPLPGLPLPGINRSGPGFQQRTTGAVFHSIDLRRERLSGSFVNDVTRYRHGPVGIPSGITHHDTMSIAIRIDVIQYQQIGFAPSYLKRLAVTFARPGRSMQVVIAFLQT